jgi:myosin regulatory light chain 9/myosin regulatory light chain 12
MLDDAPGQINFTMFLTLFGEKLNGLARGILPSLHTHVGAEPLRGSPSTGTDAEDVIRNAFGTFDPDASGLIDEERYGRACHPQHPHTCRLRELLTTMGDRFTEQEVCTVLCCAVCAVLCGSIC